jgi:UDPglucose 6-dehydrogenase
MLEAEGVSYDAYDPMAEPCGLSRASTLGGAVEGKDALILLTPWPEFRKADWTHLAGLMKTPIIVDTKNYLNREELEEAGFIYKGFGR